MAETNSTLIRSSRYVSGGTTEVNATAIEWWDRLYFTSAPDDTLYVVPKSRAGRLDQISAELLGEPRWWWIIAMQNNILDPALEVVEGTVLYVPSVERVKTTLSGTSGGLPSQRELTPSILPIV
jgi:hypothetical protein